MKIFTPITLLFIFMLPLISSCTKQQLHTQVSLHKLEIPLHITMPQARQIFEDLAPQVYESLCHHFRRVGYKLVDTSKNNYRLAVAITSLTPHTKFVSPDVLLFHLRKKLELTATLYGPHNEIIGKKQINVMALISKPINPILKSNFLHYEYQKILRRAVPQIEHHFRPLLIERFTQE